MENERRRFLRIPKETKVEYQKLDIFNNDKQGAFLSHLKDINRTGVLFSAQEEYEKGTLLILKISLPGWEKEKNEFYKENKSSFEPLVVIGKIVWSKKLESGYETGVEFVNIDPSHSEAFIKYLKNIEEKE